MSWIMCSVPASTFIALCVETACTVPKVEKYLYDAKIQSSYDNSTARDYPNFSQ